MNAVPTVTVTAATANASVVAWARFTARPVFDGCAAMLAARPAGARRARPSGSPAECGGRAAERPVRVHAVHVPERAHVSEPRDRGDREGRRGRPVGGEPDAPVLFDRLREREPARHGIALLPRVAHALHALPDRDTLQAPRPRRVRAPLEAGREPFHIGPEREPGGEAGVLEVVVVRDGVDVAADAGLVAAERPRPSPHQ